MAEAVFADPELRDRFAMMAKESIVRDPVPDDFSWLSSESSLGKLGGFIRRIVQVPKHEIEKDYRKQQE